MIGHDWFVIRHLFSQFSIDFYDWYKPKITRLSIFGRWERWCLAITERNQQKSKSNCIRDLLHIENNERLLYNENVLLGKFAQSFSLPRRRTVGVWVSCPPRAQNWTRGVLRLPSEPKPKLTSNPKLYFQQNFPKKIPRREVILPPECRGCSDCLLAGGLRNLL